MDKNPRAANYGLIRSLGVVKHKKRQEFLDCLIEGVIKSRSVVFSEIADKIDRPIKTESIERRIQDFFQKVEIDYLQLMPYFLSFVHHGRLTLSIDRTEWDFGSTQVNVLCVVANIGKMAVPVYFEVLDNNSGNSNQGDRIKLFARIVRLIGVDRIEMLIMDREFIGGEWLRWLKENAVCFCVRVPKHHKILMPDGEWARAEELFEDGGHTLLANVVVDGAVVNCCVSSDSKGELLFLIGTSKPHLLKKTYRRRWGIEVFFQALKGRGFNMEDSCLRSLEKYRKLFAVVSMAYTICWAAGIEEGKTNPVRPKKHGYPQYSVFRRGLNLMRKFYKKQIVEPIQNIFHLARLRLDRLLKTIG